MGNEPVALPDFQLVGMVDAASVINGCIVVLEQRYLFGLDLAVRVVELDPVRRHLPMNAWRPDWSMIRLRTIFAL